jgi:predicted CopG family antitoxin
MTNTDSKQIKIHLDVAERLDEMRFGSWGKLSYNNIIKRLIDKSAKYDKISEHIRECCKLIK